MVAKLPAARPPSPSPRSVASTLAGATPYRSPFPKWNPAPPPLISNEASRLPGALTCPPVRSPIHLRPSAPPKPSKFARKISSTECSLYPSAQLIDVHPLGRDQLRNVPNPECFYAPVNQIPSITCKSKHCHITKLLCVVGFTREKAPKIALFGAQKHPKTLSFPLSMDGATIY